MRSSKRLWRSIGLVSLTATLVLLFGFGYAVNDLLNPPDRAVNGAGQPGTVSPAPAAPGHDRYLITALGDSLTKGAGDTTGQGYVTMTADLLKERTGMPVTLVNNLAINGMQTDELALKLKTDKGYRYALSQANVILLTIGGNDLFGFARAGSSQPAGPDSIDPKLAETLMPEGLKRLDAVLHEIAAINPKARLVYVGLYNPFYDMPELRDGSVQVQQWNSAAFNMLHKLPNAMLVPTADLFEQEIQKYLSSDHFHPNHEGYARMAERIVQALT